MTDDWALVYTGNLPHRVDIVIDVLKDQDIDARQIDRRDSSYPMLGEIEVYVKQENAILAKVIIEQHQL
jgi:hypothetical protein